MNHGAIGLLDPKACAIALSNRAGSHPRRIKTRVRTQHPAHFTVQHIMKLGEHNALIEDVTSNR